jgi:hypothetical protein
MKKVPKPKSVKTIDIQMTEEQASFWFMLAKNTSDSTDDQSYAEIAKALQTQLTKKLDKNFPGWRFQAFVRFE